MTERRDNSQLKDEIVGAVQQSFLETQELHVQEIKKQIETHRRGDHHLFVEQLIEKERRRKDMVEKVKQQTLGWGVIVFLSAIGSAVYKVFFKTPGSGL